MNPTTASGSSFVCLRTLRGESIMSTVPKRRGSPVAEPEHYRYGWRDVPRTDKRGRVIDAVRVPLTREDVLHPQEGDHIVESDAHDSDRAYLKNVFRAQLADDSHALVFADCGIYWDDPALRHNSPDVSVILNVRDADRLWPSFHVAREGVRPVLLIEITSPSTRSIDFHDKRRIYFRAQVPMYVIVDVQADDRHRHFEIIGYRRAATRYQRMPLGPEGRLWLEVVGLWLGSENDRVACYTAEGVRVANYLELAQGREAAEVAAQQERQRAEQERQRAEQERQRAEQERQRSEAAEHRIRELEAELRRARGEP
jgi:colicin import membrane protein